MGVSVNHQKTGRSLRFPKRTSVPQSGDAVLWPRTPNWGSLKLASFRAAMLRPGKNHVQRPYGEGVLSVSQNATNSR